MDSYSDKSAFKEPPKFFIAYVFARHKWLKPIMFILIFCVMIFDIIWLPPSIQQYFIKASSLLFDQRYAGLIGVLIGGGITAFVTYYLQLDQLKASALNMRKDQIYEPLYDSLVTFKSQLRRKHFACPIYLNQNDMVRDGTPRFDIWTEMKNDNRYIEIPKWLARAFDTFIEDIQKYLTEWKNISKNFETKLVATLVEEGYLKDAHGFGALGEILREEYDSVIRPPFTHAVSKDANKKLEAESAKIFPEICREYGQMEEVQNLRHFYNESIIEHTDWLINEIERIISYIDMRYGGQNRLL